MTAGKGQGQTPLILAVFFRFAKKALPSFFAERKNPAKKYMRGGVIEK